ncbi:MAG: hypothetical protein AAGD25_33320 [Cyanobacteria bacterium P01_F01_bin.150]
MQTARALEQLLQDAQKSLHDQQNNHLMLKQQLACKKSDVAKLDGLSLTSFFHSVLRKRKQRLAEEKHEYQAIKLKYDVSVKAVDETQEEIQRLQNKLTTFDLTRARKQLQEAIQAEKAALDSLQQVKSYLQSAINWGAWDMLGGGMLAAMVKHSKIDSAKQQVHYAQQQLRTLKEELINAGQILNMSLEIDNFLQFADFFFDGFIADYTVQSKIKRGLSACSDAISIVTLEINSCHDRLAETQREIDNVSKSKIELIEQR